MKKILLSVMLAAFLVAMFPIQSSATVYNWYGTKRIINQTSWECTSPGSLCTSLAVDDNCPNCVINFYSANPGPGIQNGLTFTVYDENGNPVMSGVWSSSYGINQINENTVEFTF